MTDTTPRMALQELVASQAQKHVTVNDDLIALDAMMDMYVKGNGTNTPPASPGDGDTYIVGTSPTGDWAEQAGKIAYCIDGGWRFYAPFNGLQAYDATSGGFIIYADGNWQDDVVTATAAQTLTNKTFGDEITLIDGFSNARQALKGSRFGYTNSDYATVILGSPGTSAHAVCLGVDFSANTGSNFDGDGREIGIPNGASFLMPNSVNTAYIKPLAFSSAGSWLPGADNSYDIGSASSRMATVYAGTGSINTSDAAEKQWRGALSDAEFAAGKAIFAEIGGFKFLDAIAKKGADKARLHFGVCAQNVRDILTVNGLDALTYAFICHDEWPATKDRSAGSRWGIRYDELIAFLLAVLDRRMAALEAK